MKQHLINRDHPIDPLTIDYGGQEQTELLNTVESIMEKVTLIFGLF